ncbi:MAG: hypothetical protein Kow0037_08050 [Calditrichia bacterium]
MYRILLAEDDKNLSRSIDILLTLEGHQVVSVYNGEEALNKLMLQRFDLLITDIVMPELNGEDLISKIRSLNPHLPIMVVSGNLHKDLVERLREKGVEHIIFKPIKPAIFRRVVERLLSRESQL